MAHLSDFSRMITRQSEDFQREYMKLNEESPEDYPLQLSDEQGGWFIIYVDYLATGYIVPIKELYDDFKVD